MNNKRRAFTFKSCVEMTDLGRGKYDHVATKQLQPDTWFLEANITSLTVIIRDGHHNTELLVVYIPVNFRRNIEVDDETTKGICRGKPITGEDIGILSNDFIFFRKKFLELHTS